MPLANRIRTHINLDDHELVLGSPRVAFVNIAGVRTDCMACSYSLTTGRGRGASSELCWISSGCYRDKVSRPLPNIVEKY